VKDENNLLSSNLHIGNCIITEGGSKDLENPMVAKWVKGCLEYDYSNHPKIEWARLRKSGSVIVFKLREAIVPSIAENGDQDFFYYLTEKQRDIIRQNPAYTIAYIAVSIPRAIDDTMGFMAYRPATQAEEDADNFNHSLHPNVNSQICMGTIGHKASISRICISDVIDLMYVANKNSAYRWFGEERSGVDWVGGQIELRESEKVNRINAR
jgi:hypothetical protein